MCQLPEFPRVVSPRVRPRPTHSSVECEHWVPVTRRPPHPEVVYAFSEAGASRVAGCPRQRQVGDPATCLRLKPTCDAQDAMSNGRGVLVSGKRGFAPAPIQEQPFAGMLRTGLRPSRGQVGLAARRQSSH